MTTRQVFLFVFEQTRKEILKDFTKQEKEIFKKLSFEFLEEKSYTLSKYSANSYEELIKEIEDISLEMQSFIRIFSDPIEDKVLNTYYKSMLSFFQKLSDNIKFAKDFENK